MEAVLKIEKNLEEYKQIQSEQLNFFLLLRPEDKPYSNTIELYDAIPKYLWRNDIEDIKPIKRSFQHRGVTYEVIISPAWIEKKDKNFKKVLPGQREELIEDALRKLACEGHGRFLDDEVGVIFTLYELQQELQRMGHGYNLNQIKEGILILGQTHMQVSTRDGKKIVGTNIFETYGLTSFEDWKGHGKDAKCFVRFNPLVTKSIKEKTFRMLNYEKSMSYCRVLARWLHKRLSHCYTQASYSEPYTILVSTIIRDSGVKQYPRISDNILEIKKSLEEMIEKQVIEQFVIQKIKSGHKIVDAKIIIRPHQYFVMEIKKANSRRSEIRDKEDRQDRQKQIQNIIKQISK